VNRLPTPNDALAAVRYVVGVDPMVKNRRPVVIRARRLLIHALHEILGLGPTEIGRLLDQNHATIHHHLQVPYEYDVMQLVIQRMSDVLTDEHRRLQQERATEWLMR